MVNAAEYNRWRIAGLRERPDNEGVKRVHKLTLAATIALLAMVLGVVTAGVLSPDARSAAAKSFSFGSTLIAMTILGKRFPF